MLPTRPVTRSRLRQLERSFTNTSRPAYDSIDAYHLLNERRLLAEDSDGHRISIPELSREDRAQLERNLSHLEYRSHLNRREGRRVPSGYSINIPMDITSAANRARGESHTRLYASSFRTLYDSLASELASGATSVNAFLPYFVDEGGAENDYVHRAPLRNYSSLEELTEHFWDDVRDRIQFLYTGMGGEDFSSDNGGNPMFTGVSFLDNKHGIEIYSHRSPRRLGSCNTNKTSEPKLPKPYDTFRVRNVSSSANNCGLACLREVNANMPTYLRIRNLFKIGKGPISADMLITIGAFYGMRVLIFSHGNDPELMYNCLSDGTTCLWYDEDENGVGHYKLILCSFKYVRCQKCFQDMRLGDSNKHTHKCNLRNIKKLTSHPNSKAKRCIAFYDIETRGNISEVMEYDLSSVAPKDCIPTKEDGTAYVIPSVPCLICFVYQPEHGPPEEFTFFGLDCMTHFVQKLMDLHSKNIYLDLYAHNGSRFDAMFVINAIKKNPSFYEFMDLEDAIIKGSRVVGFKFLNHVFRDTGAYIEGSLEKICSNFKVEIAKLKSIKVMNPESGIEEEIDTMDLCLMKPHLGPQEWCNFLLEPHNKPLYDAYLKYCMYDCKSLMAVWQKFTQSMFSGVIPVEKYPKLLKVFEKAFTLPGTIMSVFKAVFSASLDEADYRELEVKGTRYFQDIYQREEPVDTGHYWGKGKKPRIMPKYSQKKRVRFYWCPNREHERWIPTLLEDSKLGGISHVAKPGLHRGKLAVIDVKSLYASVMLGCQYPQGAPIILWDHRECMDFIMKGPPNMGVFRVKKAIMKTNCIAPFPARTPNGLDWSATEIEWGALTCMDIRRIIRQGGEVEILQGLGWTKTWNPFVDVIGEVTRIKCEQDKYKEAGDPRYNPTLREAAKLTANSLFGKMLETLMNEKWIEFDNYHAYANFDPECKYMLRHCNGKMYLKHKSDPDEYPPIQLGVFILAWSRERMQNYFDIVGRHNVIASETDSIHCQVGALTELKQSVDPIYRIGEEYGQMVIDYDGNISEAMFLGKKCYVYLKIDGPMGEDKKNYKKRCKGVSTKCLTPEFYWTLYNNGSSTAKNMKVFKRALFTETNTGVSITFIDKTLRRDSKIIYREYNEHGVVE